MQNSSFSRRSWLSAAMFAVFGSCWPGKAAAAVPDSWVTMSYSYNTAAEISDVTTYVYDAKNRLTRIEDGLPGEPWEVSYPGDPA